MAIPNSKVRVLRMRVGGPCEPTTSHTVQPIAKSKAASVTIEASSGLTTEEIAKLRARTQPGYRE